MEYVNINMLPMGNNFNWDNIEVGNHALDHSQNFFAKTHIEHERLDESKRDMDLFKEIDAITLNDTFCSKNDKENLNPISTPKSAMKSPLKEMMYLNSNKEKQNAKIRPLINRSFVGEDESSNKKEAVVMDEPLPNKVQHTTTNPTVFSESLIVRNRARINPGGDRKKSPSKSPSTADVHPVVSNPVVLSESLITRNKARINPGKKKERATTTTTTTTIASSGAQSVAVAKHSSAPGTPHAYQCNELYKRRKQELLRKRLDEERKMREFHSRPVPNFSACHKSLQQRKVVHAVTVPVTPVVLKKSRETEEKRKQKLEALKQLHPPKFEPRPTTILHEEPFVPKKTQTVLVPCPFNLRSEKRLQERKQYDAAMQQTMDFKQKQEEEERKKREELHIKELRKRTTFKARPNPFK